MAVNTGARFGVIAEARRPVRITANTNDRTLIECGMTSSIVIIKGCNIKIQQSDGNKSVVLPRFCIQIDFTAYIPH